MIQNYVMIIHNVRHAIYYDSFINIVTSHTIQIETLWSTLDVSYPLALSVTGWLDVIPVLSWTPKPLQVIIVPHSHQDPGQ